MNSWLYFLIGFLSAWITVWIIFMSLIVSIRNKLDYIIAQIKEEMEK